MSPGQRDAREKVNPTVIGAVQQKGGGMGLSEYLPEVLVLHENGRATSEFPGQVAPTSDNGHGPAHYSTRRPVDEGIVLLEPG
jgi:hypothetical protein